MNAQPTTNEFSNPIIRARTSEDELLAAHERAIMAAGVKAHGRTLEQFLRAGVTASDWCVLVAHEIICGKGRLSTGEPTYILYF